MSLNGGAQRVVTSIVNDQENDYSVYVLRQLKYCHSIGQRSVFSLSFARSIFFSEYIILNLFPTIYLFSWLGIFKKVVIFEHNTTNRRRRYSIFKKIDKFIYKFSYKIVGCSSAISDSLSQWLNKPILTLNNCFDDAIFNCDSVELSNRLERIEGWLQGDGHLHVIMVGSFTNQKKQLSILQAMKLRDRIRLTLIGDGENKKNLEFQAKRLGLEASVDFVGVVENPEVWMRSADLMLHVANWEGFGLVALEAQGMDLPIICSNVEGLAKLVAPESLLVSNDSAGILNALDNITREKLNAIIAVGRENRKNYTLASYVKNLRKVLYEC